MSALQAAILAQPSETVIELLHRTRDIRQVNFRRQSLAHLAVQRPNILSALLDRGLAVMIDSRDTAGATPLMYAAAYGSIGSTLELLKHGADIFSTDLVMRWDFLRYAIHHRHWSLLAAVAKHLSKSSFP